MTNTNSFKPGDKVKYKEAHEQSAHGNGHLPNTIYIVKQYNKYEELVYFEGEAAPCFDFRLELIPSGSSINIEQMKKESLQKIEALIKSELQKFTDIGLNTQLTISESNVSNNNLIRLNLSA